MNTVIFAKCCKIDMLFFVILHEYLIFIEHHFAISAHNSQQEGACCVIVTSQSLVLCCSLSVAVRIVVYFYVGNVNSIKSNAGC